MHICKAQKPSRMSFIRGVEHAGKQNSFRETVQVSITSHAFCHTLDKAGSNILYPTRRKNEQMSTCWTTLNSYIADILLTHVCPRAWECLTERPSAHRCYRRLLCAGGCAEKLMACEGPLCMGVPQPYLCDMDVMLLCRCAGHGVLGKDC